MVSKMSMIFGVCRNASSLNLDVVTVIFHIKHVSFVILHIFQGHLGHEGF